MGFGQILTVGGFTIVLFSLSLDGERFFDITNGGVFLGIMVTLMGLILYIKAKKSNGMIRAR